MVTSDNDGCYMYEVIFLSDRGIEAMSLRSFLCSPILKRPIPRPKARSQDTSRFLCIKLTRGFEPENSKYVLLRGPKPSPTRGLNVWGDEITGFGEMEVNQDGNPSQSRVGSHFSQFLCTFQLFRFWDSNLLFTWWVKNIQIFKL